jgi:hypothetical protein
MDRKTLASIGCFAIFIVVVHACTRMDDDDVDSREGELGRVTFSGGGCTSSTTMAVGSTVELDVQPVEGETIPSDMEVRSSEPDVIDASRGEYIEQVVLEALEQGEANVELVSGGEVWDWLGFDAEPAATVVHEAADAVYAGDVLFLYIQEVYGECGEKCDLIGGEFMDWTTSPTDSLVLEDEVYRTSVFRAGTPGEAMVTGDEPSAGALLVSHPVTVLDPATAGDLDARVTLMLPDDELVEDEVPPIEVPAGTMIQIEFFAPSGGIDVPVSRYEVEVAVTGDSGVVGEYLLEPLDSPEGPVFNTMAAGSVSLEAYSALIDRTTFVDISVTE